MRNKSCSFIVFWKQNKRRTTGGRNITTRWWNIEAQCNECKVSCTLQEALFSADGELTYIFQCPKCKTLVRRTLFASALAHRALMQDFHAKTNQPNTPVQPLLQLPPAPRTLTKQDVRDLRSLHIDPEDGRLEWVGVQKDLLASTNWRDTTMSLSCIRATDTAEKEARIISFFSLLNTTSFSISCLEMQVYFKPLISWHGLTVSNEREFSVARHSTDEVRKVSASSERTLEMRIAVICISSPFMLNFRTML